MSQASNALIFSNAHCWDNKLSFGIKSNWYVFDFCMYSISGSEDSIELKSASLTSCEN